LTSLVGNLFQNEKGKKTMSVGEVARVLTSCPQLMIPKALTIAAVTMASSSIYNAVNEFNVVEENAVGSENEFIPPYLFNVGDVGVIESIVTALSNLLSLKALSLAEKLDEDSSNELVDGLMRKGGEGGFQNVVDKFNNKQGTDGGMIMSAKNLLDLLAEGVGWGVGRIFDGECKRGVITILS